MTFQKNIPLYSVFELTYRCNLNCIHCYIPEQSRIQNSKVKIKKELTTDEIKDILKQLANAGCLYLVFTGGEVFLRQDFLDLCAHARKLHFDLRIFTNGTLIDRETAYYLSKIGVSGVEVSLYGKEETHNSITQVGDSFQKAFNAIKTLIEYNVGVTIKAPLMKKNFRDYDWLIEFSKKMKIRYKFDPVLVPKNDGDKSNLKYQLTDRQTKHIFSDKKLSSEFSIYSDTRSITYSLFCSAGRNFAGISPEGKVYPCIQFLYPLGDLRKNSFKEIWFSSKKTKYLRSLTPEDCKVCFQCDINVFCRRCPGLVYLETGSVCGKSEISCHLAGLYAQKTCDKSHIDK